MPGEKDRTDEAPEPTKDLGLPTPPSPDAFRLPTCRLLPRTTHRLRNRIPKVGLEIWTALREWRAPPGPATSGRPFQAIRRWVLSATSSR